MELFISIVPNPNGKAVSEISKPPAIIAGVGRDFEIYYEALMPKFKDVPLGLSNFCGGRIFDSSKNFRNVWEFCKSLQQNTLLLADSTLTAKLGFKTESGLYSLNTTTWIINKILIKC